MSVTDIAPVSQHISVMLADLYDALETGRPWSLVRLGDGELKVLQRCHSPLSHYENRIASDADMASLYELTVQAITEADFVGWHQDPWLTERLTAIGVLPAAYDRSQYGWVNLHMAIRRGFVERVLRGKRLFLVGEPMARWYEQVLAPAGLGVDATIWQGETTIATIGQLQGILRAVDESQAQVVLASMGVWALAIAGHAKCAGKIGIDWGHTPDHHLKFDEPHWRYAPNLTEEDSPAGTMRWYPQAGCPLCLPEEGY